ncbi:Amino acid ABC transporter, periplasmic amino acid-binding protein [Planococcus halocryophilus Or1]|uniref:Amino acid ABC transporter substrate-binding protein n=1 Tax=Planococcus halocryophilus TaxID=1215089 RepID=A0A1C7DTL3_9BACL|nr:transporter substrate-binding domain-containing protein [Planococcus halocryophilus]ANU14856.1 amino acid ABC transporter substrate-binding protein [Planococcus halocryophilus]EMF45230.1 Amino acid ABC transporter, periplasmic amino acid-binding protein [Planococcus halocryophilus Or1]
MKKLFWSKKLSLVAVLAIVSLLSACGNDEDTATEEEKSAWDEIQEDGSLTVATSGTLFPTSYRSEGSDELTGFEVEVVREIGERLELEIEFTELGFDEMLTSVQTGQVDLAANDIEITEDREEKFIFSTPFKYSYGTAIVRSGDLSGIETLEDLEGKKAAGASTSVYMQMAREYGAEEVVYDNATNETYLRDVAIGRTDVILNDYYLQTLALAAFPELEITIHPDLKYSPSEVGVVMNKDNTELADNVNRVIEEMLEDGTIAEISAEFFNGADVTQKVNIEE